MNIHTVRFSPYRMLVNTIALHKFKTETNKAMYQFNKLKRAIHAAKVKSRKKGG